MQLLLGSDRVVGTAWNATFAGYLLPAYGIKLAPAGSANDPTSSPGRGRFVTIPGPFSFPGMAMKCPSAERIPMSWQFTLPSRAGCALSRRSRDGHELSPPESQPWLRRWVQPRSPRRSLRRFQRSTRGWAEQCWSAGLGKTVADCRHFPLRTNGRHPDGRSAAVHRESARPHSGQAAAGWLWAPTALQIPAEGAVTRIAVAIATAILALTIAVVVIRRLLARRALARRVTYNLLPTTSFDPTPEDVERFAFQLARTRPAESRWRPRRTASVRIRLFTDGDARLTYQLSGPVHADSVLRHQGYAQVELRRAEASSSNTDDDAAANTDE